MLKTLRLLMPQWQGGNNPAYSFGATLLEWLAPNERNEKVIEVPISSAHELTTEKGIVGRSELLQQLATAKDYLNQELPDKLVVFGGDCLVEQAPIDYLNGKYGKNFGVLWIDAHPDVSNTSHMDHAHAMVLGNLLGKGDQEFSNQIEHRLKPEQVVFVGLENPAAYEAEIIQALGIKDIRNHGVAYIMNEVKKWISEQNIVYLMIHFDVDVLDSTYFRSTLFANPYTEKIVAPEGTMHLSEVAKIIEKVSDMTQVVGFGMTEFLPWDMMNLKELFTKVKLFKE